MQKAFLAIIILFGIYSCGDDTPKVKVSEGPKNLDSLLKQHPDSIPLLLERGALLIEQEEYELALADGARAFRLDSNNLDARRLYAEALSNKPYRTVSDISSAQRNYLVVVKKRPKDVKALVGLASTYRLQEDYPATFKYVNKALRIDPKYRDAYVLKGSTYLILGNNKLAKSSYETAVQQDPEFFQAYMMLGMIYQGENDPLCIQYYTTASQLQPGNQEAKYSLAFARYQFGDVKPAIELYRELAQDTSEFYVQRGLFHIGYDHQFGEKENLDSAIYYYNSALQTNPMYVEAWYNLGICYADKGQKTQALQSYSKALKYARQYNYNEDFIKRIQKDADKSK